MKHVNIYSIHYNRTDFIQWQHDSFACHLDDNFTYNVINNAKDINIKNDIFNMCKEKNINCIETNSFSDLAGKHHIDSFNYIWKNIMCKNTDSYSMIMDGDCFLIKKLNINKFVANCAFAGPKQKRLPHYYYLTPSIIIANMEKIVAPETIDWEGLNVDGVNLDSGGGFYIYLKQHPDILNNIKELKSSWHIKEENQNKHCLPDSLLGEYDDEFHIEFFGNEFLHYCRSSNWNHQSTEHHIRKTNFVKKFVYGTINNNIIAKEHNFQCPNEEYFGWNQ